MKTKSISWILISKPGHEIRSYYGASTGKDHTEIITKLKLKIKIKRTKYIQMGKRFGNKEKETANDNEWQNIKLEILCHHSVGKGNSTNF